jgi:hypothetical protein
LRTSGRSSAGRRWRARGQHEDGDAGPGGAQFAANRPSILAREHHIQDEEIVLVDRGQVDGLVAIGGDIDGVGLLAQAPGDEAGDPGFVLHQQNAHAVSIVRDGR